MKALKLLATAAAAVGLLAGAAQAQTADGTAANPYRVMLVPADGGTEDGTKADFKPVFDAITKSTGIHFDIKVGQTYGAVIEAHCSGVIEIAWYGAASYLPAKERGCAELLALDVNHGNSTYFSGIFVKAGSPVKSLADLKGKGMAFGDPNSTSSFVYPVAMLLAAGLDPAKDLAAVRMTGSHANSLKALSEGHVDAAAASFDSLEKAVNKGSIKPGELIVLAKSDPIPNPPIAMSTKLPAEVKQKLRDGFNNVHKSEGVKPEMVRGYGGKKVDRYDASIKEEVMAPALVTLSKVSKDVRQSMITKAGQK
ncbi:MAG: phosphate/phosphite/phosphonate ABC transporter substrate-binding protein [Alphaproteobacteria bacterium]|nr:phosphate/phosphite/phosphonate ABC transporter substrate-binding protein [Alphaproteobacteria bacterium]